MSKEQEILVLIKNEELSNTIVINTQEDVDGKLHSFESGTKVVRVIQFGNVYESENSAGFFVEILSLVGPETLGSKLGSIDLNNFIQYNDKKLIKIGYTMISRSKLNKQIIKDERRLQFLSKKEDK
jgi:hypothetical protein